MQSCVDRRCCWSALQAIALATLLASGCDDRLKPKPAARAAKTADASSVKKSARPDVLASDKLDARLAEKIKAVLANCQVDKNSGVVKSCTPPSVGLELQQTEQELGAEKALLSYCHALTDKYFKRLRALACSRIGFIGKPKPMRAVSEKAYRCLFEAFKQSESLYEMNVLVRVATYIAAALGKEAELIEHTAKLRPNLPRIVVHNVLWANARLRVLPRLQALAASSEKKDATLLAALVRGMVHRAPDTAEEKKQVCAALVPLLGHDRLDVASAAAHRLMITCDAKARDQVLTQASRLVQDGKVDKTLIMAVSGLGMPTEKPYSAAQKRKAIDIFTAMIASKKLNVGRRTGALNALGGLEPAAARRIARRYASEQTEKPLREAAERILEKARKHGKR